MLTENIGAFIVCTNPDKPVVNAIIKNTKLLYQNNSNPSVWTCSEECHFQQNIIWHTGNNTKPTCSTDVSFFICEQYQVGLLGHFILTHHMMSTFLDFLYGRGGYDNKSFIHFVILFWLA